MKTQSNIVVRYAETDQMGIAHHSVYAVWYEVARSDFIKQIGMTYSEMEKEGVMTPVVELTSKYRLPACYEDELTIEVSIGRLIQFIKRARNVLLILVVLCMPG